jgi:hypothetical protein
MIRKLKCKSLPYLSWLATFYNCAPFMVLVWSYHWWSRYPFILMPCGSECTIDHDTLWDIAIVIVLKSGTHVQREVSHFLPCHIRRQVDNLITKNDFRTLMDNVIVDITHIDIVQWTSTMIAHATMMVIKEKTQCYVEWALGNDFIPFAIGTYGCFCFCFDSFVIACA